MTSQQHHRLYMDSVQAPLNPCSIETIPEPVELADGRRVWPLMLSCYQLQEGGEGGSHDGGGGGKRVGQMDLALIDVPDIVHSVTSMPLHFDPNPTTILDPSISSGILDGKWKALPGARRSTGTSSGTAAAAAAASENCNRIDTKAWAFASAHSTGEIRMHSFRAMGKGETNQRLQSEPLCTVEYMGQSEIPTASHGAIAPLCLSLSWDSPAPYKHSEANTTATDPSRIVSTYSDGTVAIHDVTFGSDNTCHFVEHDSWKAHAMFTSPAEVWSGCFVPNGQNRRNLVLTGGDEGKMKLWDLRSTTRPMQILQPSEAGVTCLSPHPTCEHLIAIGSCAYIHLCVGPMFCTRHSRPGACRNFASLLPCLPSL
jgi:hypothetical protein